jgi:hypothetical protein
MHVTSKEEETRYATLQLRQAHFFEKKKRKKERKRREHV